MKGKKYESRTTETVKDRVNYPERIIEQLGLIQAFYSAGDLPFDAIDILFEMVGGVTDDLESWDKKVRDLKKKCRNRAISPKTYCLKSYRMSVQELKRVRMLVRTETDIRVAGVE